VVVWRFVVEMARPNLTDLESPPLLFSLRIEASYRAFSWINTTHPHKTFGSLAGYLGSLFFAVGCPRDFRGLRCLFVTHR